MFLSAWNPVGLNGNDSGDTTAFGDLMIPSCRNLDMITVGEIMAMITWNFSMLV